MRDGDDAGPAAAVLESGVRLSESLLWDLQRGFYEDLGPAVWTQRAVPWWGTTNPAMGLAYAQMALAFLQDCLADDALGPDGRLDVVELGAGHGRLSHYVSMHLRRLMAAAGIAQDRVRYIFTDVAERNVAFFESHPRFRPSIDAGLMDCALFDAEHPGDLLLRHAGEPLGA